MPYNNLAALKDNENPNPIPKAVTSPEAVAPASPITETVKMTSTMGLAKIELKVRFISIGI